MHYKWQLNSLKLSAEHLVVTWEETDPLLISVPPLWFVSLNTFTFFYTTHASADLGVGPIPDDVSTTRTLAVRACVKTSPTTGRPEEAWK